MSIENDFIKSAEYPGARFTKVRTNGFRSTNSLSLCKTIGVTNS